MSRYRCQRCERDAYYVDVRPYIVDYGREPQVIHILCYRCGQADPANGYWFKLSRWFEGETDLRDSTREYTIRDHIADTKRDGAWMVHLISEALAAQKVESRPRRSRGSTAAKPKRQGLSQRKRFDILRRDDFRCQICGRTAEDTNITLHVDHQQPLAKGGTDADENLWTLCSDCNIGKGAQLA